MIHISRVERFKKQSMHIEDTPSLTIFSAGLMSLNRARGSSIPCWFGDLSRQRESPQLCLPIRHRIMQ